MVALDAPLEILAGAQWITGGTLTGGVGGTTGGVTGGVTGGMTGGVTTGGVGVTTGGVGVAPDEVVGDAVGVGSVLSEPPHAASANGRIMISGQ
ncbi:hypothetical protein [Aquirhabdus parva]|uniref:hypothetical protein n=1 Tax=Aquirhabdus parva TaxID=2283318 RepID=UPI0013B405B4|nr:hypothetical protein [Aquirhabdus parva]